MEQKQADRLSSIYAKRRSGHVHTAIFKMGNNRDLLDSAGNSAHCYVAAWMEGKFGGEWIHVSPFAVHLKLPRHSKLAIPQHKTKSLKSGRKKKRELIRNAHQVTETVLRAMEKPRQKVMTPAL